MVSFTPMKTRLPFLLAGLLMFCALGAFAQETPAAKPAPKLYPFATCIVSGEKLGEHGDPLVLIQDGYEVKFSRPEYAEQFKKDPAKYMAKIQQAYKDAKPYPLDICMVSGEKFTMGPPFTFVYEGREIKMCCDGCLDDFQKTPAKYLEIWDRAAARLAKTPAQAALQAASDARK